ncbi:hypothetical protein DFH09DRAFT_1331639 [Mycena vulgaris]|nr:hypothetical protein DFH09DRAFT_1331639 [Mycena vulgaris]
MSLLKFVQLGSKNCSEFHRFHHAFQHARQCRAIGLGTTLGQLQALPRRREGSAGYGSGAFDVTSQSSYLTASDTLDGFLGSASPTVFAPSFETSHAVQADIPRSVRTVPPTELHTLLHQTLNSTPVSIDDEWQQILNQLGPNGLAESGTVGDISNADQFDFSSISPFPSRPPSSASDYNMFETRTGNPDASLGHYYSGPPSSGSEWEIDYQSDPSRPASASPFPGDFDWHDESFEAFSESTSVAPALASDLEQHENDFGTFTESTSNYSALDWDSELVGTDFPKLLLQLDSDVKDSSSDDGHTPYELTPDEIDVVIGPTTASVTSSSARDLTL